jgi:hypothetical protein
MLTEAGQPTAGLIRGLVVGAGLCLLARWRGWILPSADAWSPANVVPARYRRRLRRRVVPARRDRGTQPNGASPPTDRDPQSEPPKPPENP